MPKPLQLTVLLLALVLPAGTLLAHGKAEHAPATAGVSTQQAWGIAGDAARVTRSVEIRMRDDMRFRPDRLRIRRGETVRLVLRNEGRMLHELVIGTKAVLDEHAARMRKFPDMEHDEPWMAHVGPGETGQIVWRFNRVGDFDFACLIPGHYEAGMVGRIEVRP